MDSTDSKKPTVFLTWAHSDETLPPEERTKFEAAWEAEIKGLVAALEAHGLNVIVDYKVYNTPGIDWARYGPRMITEADRIVIAMNSPWMRRFNAEIAPGKGIGVLAEANALLALQESDHVAFQRNVCIVQLPSADKPYLGQLNSLQRKRINELTPEGVRDLVALLTGQADAHEADAPVVVELAAGPAAGGTDGARPGAEEAADARARYAEAAMRMSDDRRRRRLAGAGLSSPQIDAAVLDIEARPLPLLEVPVDALRVLVGPAGVGKSERAEQFHRAAIEAFRAGEGPLPVWVHASELGGSLPDLVETRGGELLRGGGAVALVVDGLDESFTTAARGAVEVLARWPGSQVLVTARDRGQFEDGEVLTAHPLGAVQGRRLMTLVAGRPVELSEQVLKLIERPLFALLAARAVDADGRLPAGGAEVIDAVVRDVLEQSGGYRAAYPVLQELAIRTVRAGGPVDPGNFAAADVVANHLLTSPFVTSSHLGSSGDERARGAGRRDRRCGFAVATVEQWFAARALAEGRVLVEDEIANMRDFDRWRWALALLVAVGEPEKVDPVLAALARWNPGAASWVVQEVTKSGLATEHIQIGPDEVPALAKRLLFAFDAWLAGLGPLAEAVQLMSGHPVAQTKLGVDFDEYRGLAVWWSPQGAGEPRVVTTAVDPFGSFGMWGTPRTVGRNWVWEWSQSVLGRAGTAHMEPTAVRAALEAAAPTVTSEWQLLSAGAQARAAVYPEPDLEAGAYSAARMRELHELVFTRALKCYRELVEAAASGFGDTLRLRGLMPIELYGNVSHRDGDVPGDFGVSMKWCIRARGEVQVDGSRRGADVVNLTVNDADRARQLQLFLGPDERDDQFFEEFRRYVAEVPHADFLWPFQHSSGRFMEIFDEPAPALTIATAWLRGDLARLGWFAKT